MSKHYIFDESIGVEREYTAIDKLARVGDIVIHNHEGKSSGNIFTVGKIDEEGNVWIDRDQYADFDDHSLVGFADDGYKVLVPTDKIRVDDKTYRLVYRKAGRGDMILAISNQLDSGRYLDVLGDVFEVVMTSRSAAHTVQYCFMEDESYGDKYIVIEPLKKEEKETVEIEHFPTNDDLLELVTRLTRRLNAVEEEHHEVCDYLDSRITDLEVDSECEKDVGSERCIHLQGYYEGLTSRRERTIVRRVLGTLDIEINGINK